MNIVIAGVVKNCSSYIEQEIAIITKAFNHFNIKKILIIESNSNDESPNLLREIALKNPLVDVLSLGCLEGTFFRTEKIAFSRNKYMEILEKNNYYDSEYIFVTDFDGVNTHLTEESVECAFQVLMKEKNSAVTANQLYKYYDIWALRERVWCSGDCWKNYAYLLSLGITKNDAHTVANLSKMIHIPTYSEPIQVESSFGGGAIYPVKLLKGCRYKGLDSNNLQVCEHISFSRTFGENGGDIYICPGFINHDKSEHVLNAEKFFINNSSKSLIRF